MSLPKPLHDLQQKLEKVADDFSNARDDYSKLVDNRSALDSQLLENTTVFDELQRLEAGTKVFKRIGPTLVPQALDTARENVSKRLDFIKKEVERAEKLIVEAEKKVAEKNEQMMSAQNALQAESQRFFQMMQAMNRGGGGGGA